MTDVRGYERDRVARLVAREMWATKPGVTNRPKHADVAEKASVPTSSVTGLLNRAVGEHLVDVQVIDRYPRSASEDKAASTALNKKIMDRWTGSFPPPRMRVTEMSGLKADVDASHAYVGRNAAELVGPVLGEGERLLVSAGRAAASFVENLAHSYPEELAQLRKLYALTGGSAATQGRVPGVSLDADSVVASASRQLHQVRPDLTLETRRTLLPAAAWSENYRNELVTMFAPFLNDWSPEEPDDWAPPPHKKEHPYVSRRPDWLVAGVGVVSADHALVRGQNPFIRDDDDIERLDSVLEAADSNNWLVVEVAHRIFLCDPRTGTRLDPSQLEPALEAQLQAVNERTIRPSLRNLRQAKRVVLLAAGRHKAPAVRALVYESEFRIHHVVVDTEIASHPIWSRR